MKRTSCILLALLLACELVQAQISDSSNYDIHLAAGTSVASGFGHVQSLTWVAPTIEWHPTSRLTVNTGFAAVGNLMPTGYKLNGHSSPSLAPFRPGTRATALWADATYQVNSRLWVWGALAYMSGFAQPLWLDNSLPLQATTFSGGFGYRFGEHSTFEMEINIVHDNYGTLPALLYDTPLWNHGLGFSRIP